MFEKRAKNYVEKEEIDDFLTQNKIKAVKLNNTVDPAKQNLIQKEIFL